KSTHAMISHQELSAQQVAAYLMEHGDHYTSHEYRNVFWTSFEKYVQDYMSRSFALQDMCIWDFVTQVEKQKIKLSQDHDTTNAFAGDDVTESDFQESMELDQFADTDNTFSAQKVPEKASEDTHDQRVSVEDIMKTKTRLRPSFELLDNHVESKTHRLVVCHPDRRCIPVPIGPSLPRRDRLEVRERYCRVMLILFKPWISVDDLRSEFESWSDAFENFIKRCGPNKLFIMKNMQILHECKDSRDDHFANRRQR
ncbi:hypothetical protein BD769DRAFT_1294014, partial [Suillus cothurnatus]